MINFRFHLVSLVAVFLALTVGIVVGATIVNQAIVDGLNHRIDRVEKNADTQRAANQHAERDERPAAEVYLDGIGAVRGRGAAHRGAGGRDRGAGRRPRHGARPRDAAPGRRRAEPGDRVAAVEVAAQQAGGPRRGSRRSSATPATAPSCAPTALAALADRLGTTVRRRRRPRARRRRPRPSSTPADVLDALTTAGFVSVDAVGASGTTDLSTFPTPGPRASCSAAATRAISRRTRSSSR